MKISNQVQPNHTRMWPKLLILLILIGGITAFFALGGNRFLTLDAIQANRDRLLTYSNEHYWGMMGIWILIYTAATAFSIPVALVLSLTTGFIFGRWAGATVIVFSATLGAALVFIVERYLFADAARSRLEKSRLGGKIIQGFSRDAFSYLLFLRLVPLFPFWLVNMAPAFTPVSLRTYFTATAIGIIPGSFVFANLGQSLGQIRTLNNLLSPEIIIALALLGLFSLIPIIFKRLRNKNKEN